jgi:uncharacterized protein (TIGR02466 family)
MKQTHLFFPTPIVQDTIESDLEQYVMDLSRSDEGVKLSNKGGYQSKHFQKPEKEFQDLWEQIEGKLNEFHKDIAKLKGNVQINEWWFNVNHKGCMNRQHQHPSSLHSGVYYIKAPDKCGDICFPNPNQTLMWGWPGGIVREQNQVNSGIVSMKPLKNLLYIFPSWANHSVDANESEEPRISLSFNTGLIQ